MTNAAIEMSDLNIELRILIMVFNCKTDQFASVSTRESNKLGATQPDIFFEHILWSLILEKIIQP